MNPLSNRKKQCAKGLRDDSFGVIARLEVAELVKKLVVSFEKGGLELDHLLLGSVGPQPERSHMRAAYGQVLVVELVRTKMHAVDE